MIRAEFFVNFLGFSGECFELKAEIEAKVVLFERGRRWRP